MRNILLACAGAMALCGCAMTSKVVPIGPDTYMVSKQASTGFSGTGTVKAEAMEIAGNYCSKQGKTMQVTHTEESRPPYVLGNFPRAEVQFMCLSNGDPELARPKMRSDG